MALLADVLATSGAWTIDLLVRFHRSLPRSLDLWLTAKAGFLFGRLSPHMRRPLISNLRTILEMSEAEAENTADRVFQNFALTLHDFFIRDGVTIEVPGRAHVERAHQMGKGVLVLTFHLGHWELGARTMQSWGWPVTAVYQPYRNKKFKELIEGNRAPGVNFVAVGGTAARGVRDALRRGDLVAMLGDHPFGEEGGPVSLLGHRIMWPRGPIVLAVREGCPIVIAVIVRIGRQHYRAFVEEPLMPTSRSLTEVDRLSQAVVDKFGKIVRSYPTQWYRFRAFDPAPASVTTPNPTPSNVN